MIYPNDSDAERASNSYLMSMIVFIIGVPLPISNLIASIIFFLSNRKTSYFVRWHCTQALLSQLATFFINSASFWWTFHIIFGNEDFNNKYISYLVFVIIFNLIEFISTIYTAIQVRKGKHISWFVFGDITNLITSKNESH